MMAVYFCFKIGYKSAQQSKLDRTAMWVDNVGSLKSYSISNKCRNSETTN